MRMTLSDIRWKMTIKRDMRYNYDIYIKGKGWKQTASCAIFVVEDGCELFKGGKGFADFIPTKDGDIPILPYKEQYQMELYALAWALSKCHAEADVTFYTNNMAFRKWIERGSAPPEYENLFRYCVRFMEGKNINMEHVKKGSDCFTEECNRIANELCPNNVFK